MRSVQAAAAAWETTCEAVTPCCARCAPRAPVQALWLAQRPVPAELCSLLGALTQSRSLCARAVHSEPWREEGWGQLGRCAG